jgi:hypothetical protein
MSAETLRKRRARRGESLEAWLERQRKIDAEQVAQPVHNPAVDEYWYYNTPDCDLEVEEGPHGRGWGDTYNIDADEQSERANLERVERELWERRLDPDTLDMNSGPHDEYEREDSLERIWRNRRYTVDKNGAI